MKRVFLLLSLLVLPVFSYWNVTEVDPAVGNSYSSSDDAYPAVAVDASGNIHIVYFDFTGLNDTPRKSAFKYAKISGGSTTISTIESGFNVGRKASLKIGSDDSLHIAYFDYTNNKVKYAKYNGSSWTISVVDDASSLPASNDYIALDLDRFNNPHIAYYLNKYVSGVRTYYLKYGYNDGIWHTSELVSATTNQVGTQRAIVIDALDQPNIFYSEWSWLNGTGSLKCKKNTGSYSSPAWQTETIESIVPGRIFAAKTKAPDAVHVSYSDGAYLYKVAKYTGSWTITNVDGEGPMAIDPTTNYPAIECFSYHIVYNGSTWTTQDTGVPAYMPITVAFDSAGNAYTAFYDQGALPYKIKIAKSVYSISGFVLDPYSSYLSGAVVSLAGTVATSLTISTNGTYSFDGLPRGANCTITPSKAGYTFAPAAVTIAGVAKDYTYQSFSGSYQTYKASGYVKSAGDVPMAGITVSLTGGVASSTTTSTGGYYEFLNIPQHSSVTVIPSKTGYTFSPVSGTSADLTSNLTTNFTGALGTYKISGNISTNLSGVTVYLTGATILTAVSNGSGNYEFTGLTGLTNYTLTTFKPAYSLSPTAATITGLSADTTRNFSGTLLNYSISGFVKDSLLSPLSGTTVSVTGSTNLAAATGADGSYTFSNLTGLGNYQLSTSAAHYSIAPAGITITALAANQFNQNFTGTFKTWRVRGHTWTGSSAQIAGVTVNCTGATTLGAVTDAFANYEFAELKEGGGLHLYPGKERLYFYCLFKHGK